MSKALNRLSKILNQAERAPEGSPEREAFMEKALVMSQAIGIDLAVARAHQADREKVETPTRKQIQVGQYGSKSQSRLNGYLASLFNAVATPNDIQVTFGGNNIYIYAYGFPSDIEVAEKLFASLSVQMVAEADRLLKAGANKEWVEDAPLYETRDDGDFWGGYRAVKRDEDGNVVRGRALRSKVDGRVWRANFYEGFIARISSRLYDARNEEVARRRTEEGKESGSTTLALRDKSREVVDFYKDETKHMRLGIWKPPETSMFSAAGLVTGQSVAAKASLGTETGVGREDKQALG